MNRYARLCALSAVLLLNACAMPTDDGDFEETPTVGLTNAEATDLTRSIAAMLHARFDTLHTTLLARTQAGQALPTTFALNAPCNRGGSMQSSGSLTLHATGPITPWVGFSYEQPLVLDNCAIAVGARTVTLQSVAGKPLGVYGHRLTSGNPPTYQGVQSVAFRAGWMQITVPGEEPVVCVVPLSSMFDPDRANYSFRAQVCQTVSEQDRFWPPSYGPLVP